MFDSLVQDDLYLGEMNLNPSFRFMGRNTEGEVIEIEHEQKMSIEI